MRDDATLNDVTFVDPDRGWAVGQRGLILHTRNGGREWNVQGSPAKGRLESVFFLDAQNGWIVGGSTQPFTHKSQGLVLRTYDGGQRWEQVKDAALPLLTKVKFFDAKHGWAVGLPSALYRSGIFSTDDGGRSWSPLPGTAPGAYLTADFHSPQTGAAAGYRGTLTFIRRNGVQLSRTPYLGPRPLHDLILSGPTGGWLVGEGGVCLTTHDGGLTWQTPASPLPNDVRQNFDFHAVAARDNQVWVAGSPGTKIVHSTDGGNTWQTRPTPTTAPLRAVTFVDDHHGWAVGELGTILASRDGGGTWQVQRAGGKRAAVLVIASSSQDIPWELLVKYAGNEAMLTAIEVVGREEFDARDDAETPPRERLLDATTEVGGSVASQMWRFPLRQAELNLTGQQVTSLWNQVNDGQATSRLEEALVRKIRTWRPTVLIVPSPRGGGDPASMLVSQAALAAAEKAADSTQFVEQLSLAGLQPWKVGKICAVSDDLRHAHYQFPSAALAPRLGYSLQAGSHASRALLSTEPAASPLSTGLVQLSRGMNSARNGQDLFDQVPTPVVGDARRSLSRPSAGALDQTMRWAQRQTRVERLLEEAHADPRQLDGMLAQLNDLTGGLSRSGGGHVLYQLAERLRADGRLTSAAAVYELLIEKHADHTTHDPALLWLCQYYASSEAAWHADEGTQFTVQQAQFSAAPRETKRGVAVASRLTPSGQQGTASTTNSLARARQAVALAEETRRTQVDLYADPRFRFPLAAAQRVVGASRTAEAYFHQTADREGNPWQQCAAAQLWLAQPTPQAPKPFVLCRSAVDKPYLDGKLDDACWQAAKPMPIHDIMLADPTSLPEDQPPAAEAYLSYDQEFLYFAVRCQRLGPRAEPIEPTARQRDADLSGHDRVQLLLDLDRDYTSYFRLEVDQRGQISDDCWGDRSWQPQWHVATSNDRQQWTVEAAIAWKSLARQPPQPKRAWAVNVQRIVPGEGFSSWSRPAAVNVRGEGFGLLLFEE
jgi:photosystem II stability/assembly factor-like uncharacterized protein